MGARPLSRIAALRIPRMPRWRIVRRRLLFAGLLLALLATLYLVWFRDSSLVRVDRVEIVGAEGNPGVAGALESAAAQQSTLHLDVGALRAAVADEPSVAGLSADADFPHGLTVTVDLRRPAGFLERGGGAVIAADGTVLATGIDRPAGLPVITADPEALGDRAGGDALAGAQILGSLPRVLAPQVEQVAIDSDHGPVATLAGGIEVRFGDSSGVEAKWRAVAAVLANPEFTSANYLDVSVASRPVAG